jgi:hypothetical protein
MGYILLFVDCGRVQTNIESLLVSKNSEVHLRISVRFCDSVVQFLYVRGEHSREYFAGNMLPRRR